MTEQAARSIGIIDDEREALGARGRLAPRQGRRPPGAVARECGGIDCPSWKAVLVSSRLVRVALSTVDPPFASFAPSRVPQLVAKKLSSRNTGLSRRVRTILPLNEDQ